MVVLLDPIETGGWLNVLKSNGIAKDRAYGQFLGNQIQGLRERRLDERQRLSDLEQRGGRRRRARCRRRNSLRRSRPHFQTVELNYSTSGSLDDQRWRPLIKLNAAYTYYPTYAQVLKEYNRKQPLPVFMIEAGYEFEQNSSSISKGTPADPPATGVLERPQWRDGPVLRQPLHLAVRFRLESITSTRPEAPRSGTSRRLFGGLPWFRLVPDQGHKIVTAGYGKFSTSGNVGSSNYVTTAATRDRTLAVSYLPTGGTVTVNMARFAARVQARWYDPASGKYSQVAHSPFPHSRKVCLTTPAQE